MFSVQNELLTPTFKTKRPQVEKRYTNEIAKMYETLEWRDAVSTIPNVFICLFFMQFD